MISELCNSWGSVMFVGALPGVEYVRLRFLFLDSIKAAIIAIIRTKMPTPTPMPVLAPVERLGSEIAVAEGGPIRLGSEMAVAEGGPNISVRVVVGPGGVEVVD